MKPNLIDILKDFCSDKNYFSLTQIKKYLQSDGIKYADISIKKSLKQLVDDQFIFSAGRGYYYRISSELNLDPLAIEPIVKNINRKFPLLEFSVWSTKQLNFAFHHLQNKFFTFIYADKDSLIYLRDYLIDDGFSIFLNPTKSDLKRTAFTSENSIILRNYVARSISTDHIASIEKIMVDLYLESDRLNIFDKSEYSRVFEYLLQNYRLNISALLAYAERRKILTKTKHFLTKYTNPTFV